MFLLKTLILKTLLFENVAVRKRDYSKMLILTTLLFEYVDIEFIAIEIENSLKQVAIAKRCYKNN